jgi:hypothetical protein
VSGGCSWFANLLKALGVAEGHDLGGHQTAASEPGPKAGGLGDPTPDDLEVARSREEYRNLPAAARRPQSQEEQARSALAALQNCRNSALCEKNNVPDFLQECEILSPHALKFDREIGAQLARTTKSASTSI